MAAKKSALVIPQRVVDTAGRLMSLSALEIWWQTRLSALNDRTPRQAWASGDHAEVLALVASIKFGSGDMA